MFRLDRVRSAELSGELFARPAGFDSLAFVLESLAMVPWGWEVADGASLSYGNIFAAGIAFALLGPASAPHLKILKAVNHSKRA